MNVKPNRRSIRLPGYDYAQAGWYYVTICTQHKQCFFGEIADGLMQLNAAGSEAQDQWQDLPNRFLGVTLDEFVVMPNHIHGIIVIAPKIAGAIDAIPSPTLGEIARTFKAVSTRFIRLRHAEQFAWQRNYFERIIRDENELLNVSRYIIENPQRWQTDHDYVP